MKNIFIAVLLAAFVSGCNSDLKLLDGIEKEPEIVDDISGVWVSDYCDVTSFANLQMKPPLKGLFFTMRAKSWTQTSHLYRCMDMIALNSLE